MSKINKTSKSDSFAYKTVIRSVILAGIFFVISILLNGEIIKIYNGTNEILIIFDALIKVVVVAFFFIFSILSIGNYKELSGKPLDIKEILLLFFFSLLQGYRNPLVFGFTLIGLIVILIYLYLSQDS